VVPVLAEAVMVKLPGVLPLAEETVSQVWLEDTVYAMTLVVPLLVTLMALLVAPAATGAQLVLLMAKVGVAAPVAVRTTSSIKAPVFWTLPSLLNQNRTWVAVVGIVAVCWLLAW